MLAFMSPLTLLNTAARFGAYDRVTGIAYGADPRQRLDVYRPRGEGPHPVAVFFYGGSWQEGDRALYRFVGAALASRGILTLIPDYRVYPQVRFPEFLDDAAASVRWARNHASAQGGDPDRLVLLGHSAGAHIAAMLALDPQWLESVGLSPRDLAGMAGLAGPYDFLPLKDPVLQIIFGPETKRDRTQPINFVAPDAPPLLLIAGAKDRTVDPGNSTRLAERAARVGAQARAVIYPNLDHRTILGTLSPLLRPLAPVLYDMTRFVDTVTTKAKAG
ncbi:alpha/beta hydrolase [Ancylobacter sp. SL191]|uniref:alpha/beta hydrolase n=1 Tax=Ancylobacter sp. SL191 TaxID=2995166 RepID=UPI00226F71AF|nr:alpha/beta hydrolase [Ancylobacter sp. SL191]WAC28751.1 alpha/beta hydrolase [Ancylobacter sp. SL191]